MMGEADADSVQQRVERPHWSQENLCPSTFLNLGLGFLNCQMVIMRVLSSWSYGEN